MDMVVDCSVVLAWCLADEASRVADAALERVADHGAVVPAIWWYELRNALVVNERRGRLDEADTQAILADLRDIPITLDLEHDEIAMLDIARRSEVSVYDAAYVEVARRRALPLCTLDTHLRRAAEAAGVQLWHA